MMRRLRLSLRLPSAQKSFPAGNGKGKYPTVISQLGTIEKNDPTYWPERLLLAQVFLATHNQGDGGGALNEVLALNPNNLDAQFLNVAHNIAHLGHDGERRSWRRSRSSRILRSLVDAYEGRMLMRQHQPGTRRWFRCRLAVAKRSTSCGGARVAGCGLLHA